MRGEVGKDTPKKEMDNRRIFMTSNMTLWKVPANSVPASLPRSYRSEIRLNQQAKYIQCKFAGCVNGRPTDEPLCKQQQC